jgi:transcriptional regulator with XRE-family HTH domain
VESTVNERLKILMGALNLSPAAFAKVLGVSGSTVRNYFDAERNTKPGYDVLEKLYRSFGHISLPWLLTGEGEPFLQKLTTTDEPTNIYTKKNLGNAIGTNHGVATQSQGQAPAATADCAIKLEAARELIQQLKSQLKDKEDIIQLLRKSK